jgi:SNF2 family DNA or RNA helicase
LVAAARRTWLLSGTLAPNHPGELWTHIRALFPRAFMVAGFPTAPTAFEWLKGVCNLKESPFGTVVVSAKKDRLPALRKALEPYALRRRKADVLKDLPPLRITDEPLDMSIPPGLLADADGLLPMTDDEVIEALRLGGMVTATERRMLGLSKVGPAAAWTRLQLESGVPKIILFAYHQDVLRGLQRQLADLNPLLVYGETPHRKRAGAEDLFQTDPTRRVWLGQFTASGTAITLTAADRVGVVEASWVPSDNYQAILRAHRIGQSRGVLASFLYVPNSLDQRIMSTFRRKAEELAALFD